MPNLPVNVGFDYNNGSPSWNVPSKVTVPHGEIDTVRWTLAATGLPPGWRARFSQSNPIQFVTNKVGVTNQSVWTGDAPNRVNDSLVTVDDDNSQSSGTTKDYYYSVSVDVVDQNNNATMYTQDPEIENPGG